jgi:hypothetical protein
VPALLQEFLEASTTDSGRILLFDGTCARWLPWASAPGYSARVVCSVGSGRFRGAREEFCAEVVGGAWPEFPVMYASIIDAVPEGA